VGGIVAATVVVGGIIVVGRGGVVCGELAWHKPHVRGQSCAKKSKLQLFCHSEHAKHFPRSYRQRVTHCLSSQVEALAWQLLHVLRQ